MRGKILFIAGLAAGYVVGARAGRPAYEAVVERAKSFTSSDRVQQVGEKAKQVLEEKAPAVADAASKVAETTTAAASAAADAGASADAESDSSDEKPKPTRSGGSPKPTGSAA
jgi:hypothetical protein